MVIVMTSDEKKGIVLALVGATGWGLSGTCSQFLFTHPKGILDVFKNWRTALHLVLYSVFGVTFCQLSYLSAIRYSNSGTATVLQAAGIVLVFIIVSIL